MSSHEDLGMKMVKLEFIVAMVIYRQYEIAFVITREKNMPLLWIAIY